MRVFDLSDLLDLLIMSSKKSKVPLPLTKVESSRYCEKKVFVLLLVNYYNNHWQLELSLASLCFVMVAGALRRSSFLVLQFQ